MSFESKMQFDNEPSVQWLNSRTGWTITYDAAGGLYGAFVVETADHSVFKSSHKEGPLPAIQRAAQAHGWKDERAEVDKIKERERAEHPLHIETLPNRDVWKAFDKHEAVQFMKVHHPGSTITRIPYGGGWQASKGERKVTAQEPIDAVKILARSLGWQDPSGANTGAPIGTVTKANYRLCNCAAARQHGEHADNCASREIEVTIGGTTTTVKTERVDGSHSWAKGCTCGTRDGKHANTCKALGSSVSPKVERARPTAELFDGIMQLDGSWNVYEELVKRNQRTLTDSMLDHAKIGVDLGTFALPYSVKSRSEVEAQFSKDLAERFKKFRIEASLEWLARDLGIDPAAPDDVIKATVRKRLAGQFAEYDSMRARNVELLARADNAQRRLEDALQEIASEQQENDQLRGMVAEVQLEIAKLRRARR